MTYKELVNKVLQRLREDTVNTVDETPYSLLIGDFVNETIREIEDAWDWNSLRVSIKIPTISGTYRYTLTGSNQRSKILRVFNDTKNCEVWHMNPGTMTKKYMIEDVNTTTPTYYSQNGLSPEGTPVVDFYPIPDGADTLYVSIKIPRDIITTDTTEIDLPPHMIILGAYSKAIQERGEDMGTNLIMAENKFQAALSDAIAIDQRTSGSESDWYV